jgi:outer membrane protein assembly factor BamB
VSLRDLVPVTGDGDPIAGLDGPDEVPLVRADPGGVVVVTGRTIVRHDRQGVRRWQVPAGGWQVWDAVAVGGRHLITRSRSDDGSVPFGRVAVLDLDDGSERWTRQVTQIHGFTGELLVTGGFAGEVAAFDLDDGSSRWDLAISQQMALRVVGPVVHLEPMFPERRPRGRLLDASTGTTPTHLAGGVLHPPARFGERVVTVLQGRAPGPAARVVALEPDGSVAWVHDLAADSGSGPDDVITTAALFDLTDGSVIDVVAASEGGETRTSLRLDDGAVLARRAAAGPPDARDDLAIDGLGSAGEAGGSRAGWRTVPGGLGVREDGDGLQLRGHDGTVIAVRGPEPTLVATDPVVVRGGDRLLALRVDAPGWTSH